MLRKPLAGIALAALAMTAFAGCGDDDDDDSPVDSVLDGDVSVPEVEVDVTEVMTTTS